MGDQSNQENLARRIVGVYQDLGLEPIINASGAVTRLGGAPMPPEVLAAFQQAATECVPLEQLQAVASRRIAEATGAEAGLVTAGAAAALTLGSAAMLAGYDLRRIESLPHADDFPNEFLVARDQRNGYDHAVRASGARLIEVGLNERVSNAGVRLTETWEYAAAISPRTAGVLYVYSPWSQPDLADVVACAHEHGLPVLVDAAGELPPRGNLRALLASGADLVAFSGGKAIRGPQASGLLCGRRELIGSAALQMLDMDDHAALWDPPADFIDKARLPGLPRHGMGRGYKVSKEQIVALLTALRLFSSGAYLVDQEAQLGRLQRLVEQLSGAAATTTLLETDDGESSPVLEIAVNQTRLGRSALEVCRRLRQGQPACYVGHGQLREGKLVIYPLHLTDASAAALGKRLQEELTCH